MSTKRHLTDVEVRDMRYFRKAGFTQKALVRRFGVSQGAVSMIVRGQRRIEAGGPIETTKRSFRDGR